MEIGQRIREARLAKGLTQEELGNIVGVQKSAVAKWENGKVQNIKRRTLQELAKALDLKGSDLIIEAGNPYEAAVLTMNVLSDIEIIEMLEQFNSLSEKDKQTVKDLIRSLAK